ncbi:MAG: ORF6N domain-containing protein [Clostridium sp.]
MLAKTIAEVHEQPLKRINELINNNLDEFEFGIDIIDLKGNKNFEVVSNDHGLLTQNAINRASNIYILSEQGYMLLVGFMKPSEGFKDYLNPLRFLTDLSFKTILKSEIPTLEI